MSLLPQYIIDIIYQFNADHRSMLTSSLSQIKQNCICVCCYKQCEMEICLRPNAKMFCNKTCMDFWISMRNDMRFFEEDDENDFIIKEEDEETLIEDENEQYLYDYI